MKSHFLLTQTNIITYNPEDKTEVNWPYDKPQFIILNIAMGGDLGGQIP